MDGKKKGKSAIIKQNLNPEWNETYYWDGCNERTVVRGEVWDHDLVGKDWMGHFQIDTADMMIAVREPVEKWIPVQGKSPSDKITGDILIRISFREKPDASLTPDQLKALAAAEKQGAPPSHAPAYTAPPVSPLPTTTAPMPPMVPPMVPAVASPVNLGNSGVLEFPPTNTPPLPPKNPSAHPTEDSNTSTSDSSTQYGYSMHTQPNNETPSLPPSLPPELPPARRTPPLVPPMPAVLPEDHVPPTADPAARPLPAPPVAPNKPHPHMMPGHPSPQHPPQLPPQHPPQHPPNHPPPAAVAHPQVPHMAPPSRPLPSAPLNTPPSQETTQSHEPAMPEQAPPPMPLPPVPQVAPPSGPKLTVRAVYAYEAAKDGETSLVVGDTYTVEKEEDGWYQGTSSSTGAFGWFPGNYVEKV